MTRADLLLARLRSAFADAEIALVDVSAEHSGHGGYDPRGSHFRLRMRSPAFDGLKPLARHRLVYDAIGDILLREVHAIQLELLAVSHATPGAAVAAPFDQPGT